MTVESIADVEAAIIEGRFDESASELVLANLRWKDNDGMPVCPRCSATEVYRIKSRTAFRCAFCRYDYSVTTDTIFHGHKISFSTCIKAMLIFEKERKTISKTDFAQRLNLNYKSASVIYFKLVEAYMEPSGPLSAPSFLMRGYWQGFNMFNFDKEANTVYRTNIHGKKQPVKTKKPAPLPKE